MKRILTISLFFVLTFLMTSCNTNKYYECVPINVFDTYANIVFYQDGYEDSYNAIKRKLNEISRDTNDFSSNGTNNSVYDLNIKRELEVSDTLKDIIVYSNNLISDTDGYFNPYMGRLNHKWKDAIKEKRILSKDEIDNELNIINNTSIEINGNLVKINGDGNIDLGGVVKGYALEWTRKYLNDHNITKYYLDYGSSSVYIGDISINVKITKPYESGYMESFDAINMGIATSNGKHQNMMIDGVRYHHLINPFTGYPSNNYDSISVIGNIDNGLLDAYSTAIFSMEESKAIEFAKNKELDLILYKNGISTYKKNK